MIDILSDGMLGVAIGIEECRSEDRTMANLIRGQEESGWVGAVPTAGR